MSLEVLLLGCYVMLIVCAVFLFKVNQRHAKWVEVYGEALVNLQRSKSSTR